MTVMDFGAQDSFNYPMNYCYIDQQPGLLYMGHKKAIYLLFHLPPYLCRHILLKARLILFKLPTYACSSTESAERYTLYPLKEVFSRYNDQFSPPSLDLSRRIDFENRLRLSYTEINITRLMQDWIDGTLENNGVLLAGREHSPYVFYASNWYKMPGMQPIVRLTFWDDGGLRPPRYVPCNVEVSRLGSA